MKKVKKNRGSVMVLVVLIATAVSVAAIAGLCLSGTVSNNQSKLEKSQEMNCIVSGVTQLATADLSSGVLNIGGAKTYQVGGNSISVSATANPSLANTASLAMTGSLGNIPISTSTTVAYVP